MGSQDSTNPNQRKYYENQVIRAFMGGLFVWRKPLETAEKFFDANGINQSTVSYVLSTLERLMDGVPTVEKIEANSTERTKPILLGHRELMVRELYDFAEKYDLQLTKGPPTSETEQVRKR